MESRNWRVQRSMNNGLRRRINRYFGKDSVVFVFFDPPNPYQPVPEDVEDDEAYFIARQFEHLCTDTDEQAAVKTTME